jgi:hypothetical protein
MIKGNLALVVFFIHFFSAILFLALTILTFIHQPEFLATVLIYLFSYSGFYLSFNSIRLTKFLFYFNKISFLSQLLFLAVKMGYLFQQTTKLVVRL